MQKDTERILSILFLIWIFLMLLNGIESNPNFFNDFIGTIKEKCYEMIFEKKTKDQPANVDIELRINPGMEYNYKTKAEIYNIRKKYVKTSIFNSRKYEPNETVFGQIQDRKPWWHEHPCDENGIERSRGISRVSNYVNNPGLLILIMANYSETHGTDNDRFCRAESSKYNPEQAFYNKYEKQITAKYSIEREYLDEAICFDDGCYPRTLNLIGLNARDFGYQYVYIPFIKGVKMENYKNASNSVYYLLDYIHTGGSCKIPGGCNNKSPHQPELDFYLVSLPAQIDIKLWKKHPKSTNDEADFNYRIIFDRKY